MVILLALSLLAAITGADLARAHDAPNKEINNSLLSSAGCNLRIASASDSLEKTRLVNQFKAEFESKKNICAVLIVAVPTKTAKEWVIAGYNDKRKFRKVLISNPNDELVIELKKAGEANRDKLIKLAISNLGRTPSAQRRAEPGASQPAQFKWLVGLSYNRITFSPERDNWYEYSGVIRHYWARGSLGFEYLSAERFKKHDKAYAFDAYVDLWPRAYVNLRYQFAPHHVFYPDYSYRAELWQGLGPGWEPSVSYDHLQFRNNGVNLYGVGLGKYLGNWYLQWKTLFIPATAKLGLSHRARIRYYYQSDADNFVEVNGGFSTRGDFIRGTKNVVTTHTSLVSAMLQKYVTPYFGIRVSGSYVDEENGFVERGFRVNALFRW